MICEPLISASNLTIYEDGVDDLSLCEVMITAVGEKCKRILFYTEYTQIDYLIYNPLNLKPVNPKKHYNKIPPRCKFETLTIWTCWHSCCASETRFWYIFWSAQDGVINPLVLRNNDGHTKNATVVLQTLLLKEGLNGVVSFAVIG